jgi:hypothetical protein
MASNLTLDWLVSVDDHVLEPPGLWVDCITVVKNCISHLPEQTQYKLLRGNAEHLYRFTPAEPPVLSGA